MAAKERLGFETQALLSIAFAIIGALATLAAAALVFRNFKADSGFTYYNAKGMWYPILGVALLGALGSSVIGIALGFNSAGQKRNTQSTRSWVGFFMCAGVLAFALIVGMFFFFTRQPM